MTAVALLLVPVGALSTAVGTACLAHAVLVEMRGRLS